MRTPDTSNRRAPAVAAAALALAGVAFLLQRPALADDRDLLRFDGAKPYLFILLDTSASMSLAMGEDVWTPGWADGPGSRLYQAKQALYNVLQDVDDVQYGFASYNQDHVHVTAKHYTYYNPTELPTDADTWAIAFPAAETPKVVDEVLVPADVDGDGSLLTQLIPVPRLDSSGNPLEIDPDIDETDTRVLEIAGDVLTFGQNSGTRVAGTCSDPLVLTNAADRAKLQGLPIDGTTDASGAPTRMWIRSESRTYLLEITVPGNDADGVAQKIGDSDLFTKFELRRVSTGNSCATDVASVNFDTAFGASGIQRVNRNLDSDPQLFQTLVVDGPSWDDGDGETLAGVASFSDVVSDADFSNSHPFTGKGWEGNYDSGDDSGESGDFQSNITKADLKCNPASASCLGAANLKPVTETAFSSERALDKGDLIPFDWDRTWKHDFLRRLSPSHTITSAGLGDYRLARLFGEAEAGGDPLPLLDSARRPLLAADHSPLAKSLNDFRCWYLGEEGRAGSQKCRDTTFVPEFGTGWEELACVNDPEFGCRRPYLIVISDGEDTGGVGEDANADVAALNSHSGVRTWALNVGDPRGCDSGGGLHPIVRAGGGECIVVNTQAKLRQTLQSILGEIRTEARSFASAAVPSVQATVEQKIFLTSFVPLNDSPVWDGHVHSFIKPLPTETGTGRPLTNLKCDGSGDPVPDDPTRRCHLWDAGEVLKLSQYPASGSTYLDVADADLRRVFYAARLHDAPDPDADDPDPDADDPTEPGEWPARLRLFTPLTIGDDDAAATRPWRFDLWRAMGIDFTEADSDPHVNDAAATEANAVVDHTLRLKSGTVNDVDPMTGDVTPRSITFLLGDIFHSTPIVVGTPPNTLYYAADLYGDKGVGECSADDGTKAADPGYRCFFDKQRLRRKMLLVGSNDGMLHAFDAGVFRSGGTDRLTGVALGTGAQFFDNGSGRELFAFVPRTVMETLKGFAGSNSQEYTVDGTVTVADVFIDPLRQSATEPATTDPDFPDEDDREWRTVVVGGLREGGSGYYALDITQPDPVEDLDEADDLAALFDFIPSNHGGTANEDYVPGCTSGLTVGPHGDLGLPTSGGPCGPLPFPAVLWEFDDRYYDEEAGAFFHADEDGADGELACDQIDNNGLPDLGASWSTSNVGRIRLCDGMACDPADPDNDGDLEDRFVAIFGGGMDVANKTHDWRQSVPPTRVGNWLYMVDVETGRVIYKQPLEGAAPSEPAAVDTNGDGYLDTIYIGTLAGYMYRVDLGPVGGVFPALEPWTVCLEDGATTESVARVRLPFDVWKPIKVFDTNFDGSTATEVGTPRSIYHRPSVIFSAGTGTYALAFGTGDRENLWTVGGPLERFYVFTENVAAGSTPLNEGTLQPIDALTSPSAATSFLATGGWVLRLAEDERVITDAFALSGVLIFSAFTPSVVDQDGTPINVGCGEQGNQGGGGGPNQAERTCSKQGTSAIFVVNATNANGLLFEGEDSVRFKEVPTFVTNPFAEPGQTKRSSGEGDEDDDQPTADDLTEDLIKVMESLKTLFPSQCKFANYRVDVKTIAADTSLQFIAPIPVCLIERNWKEF